MFIEAIDLVLKRLKDGGVDFAHVKGISGAGMQHGTVFWSHDAEQILGNLDPSKTLLEQLEGGAKGERRGAFSHPFSPNWQDASTQKQCEKFDEHLGSPEKLADITGSKAHHVCISCRCCGSRYILTPSYSALVALRSCDSVRSIPTHTERPRVFP